MEEVEDGEILDGQEGQLSQISQSSHDEEADKVQRAIVGGEDRDGVRTQRRKKRRFRQRYQGGNNVEVHEDDDEEENEYGRDARHRRPRQFNHGSPRSRWDLSQRRYQFDRTNNTQPRRHRIVHGKHTCWETGFRHYSDGGEKSWREKRRHFSVEERSRRNRSYSSGSHSASHGAKNRRKSLHASPEIGTEQRRIRTPKKRNTRQVSYDAASPSGLVITSLPSQRKTPKKSTNRNGNSKGNNQGKSMNLAEVAKENTDVPHSPACSNKSPSSCSQVVVEEDEVIVLPIEPKDVPLIDLVSDGEGENSSSKDELVTGSDSRNDDGETATDSAHDSWGPKDDDQELIIEDSAEVSQNMSRIDNCFIPTFQEIPVEHEIQVLTDDNVVPATVPTEPVQDDSDLMELELRRVALEGLLNRVVGKSTTAPVAETEANQTVIQVEKLREVVENFVAERKKDSNQPSNETTSDNQVSPVTTVPVIEAGKTSATSVSKDKESQVQVVSEPLATKSAQASTTVEVPVSAASEMEVDEENEDELELILLRQKLLMDMKKKEKCSVSKDATSKPKSPSPSTNSPPVFKNATSNPKSPNPPINSPPVSRDATSKPKSPNAQKNSPSHNPSTKPSTPLTSPNTIPVSQPPAKSEAAVATAIENSNLSPLNVITSPKTGSTSLKRSVQVLDSTLALNMKSGFNSGYRKRKKVNRTNNDMYSIKRAIVEPYSSQRPVKDPFTLTRIVEDPYSITRTIIDAPYTMMRAIDDPFTIKRTVVNNLVQSPFKTQFGKCDHRQVQRKSDSSKQERIVISVRPNDTSEDEDETSDVESVVPNNGFNPPATSVPVQLSESFHTSLDTFLRTVRESACKSQMNAGNPASANPQSDIAGPSLPPVSVAQTIVTKDVEPISPRSGGDSNALEEIRRSQAQWLEIESVATTDDDLSESEMVQPPADKSRKDVTAMSNEDNTNSPSANCPNKKVNAEINSQPSSKPADSVRSDVLQNSKETAKAKMSPDDTPNNDLNQLNELPLSKTEGDDGATSVTSTVSSVPKPAPKIIKRAKVKLAKKRPSENQSTAPKPGPTAAAAATRKLDAAKLKQQEIQTREELRLRERLLRSALQRNEERLKLSSKENELVKLRERVNVLMGEALSKMNTHGEKKKRSVILAKKVDELRQQLIIAEKALGKANEQSQEVRREVLSTIDEAFKMRSVAAKLSLECRTLGIKISGDKYVLPKTGAKELTEKMRSIYRNSMDGKDLDVRKGLKSASKEIYRAWLSEEPTTDKAAINDQEATTECSKEEQAVNFRVKKFLLKYDRKLCLAVSPRYHPYKSFFRTSRLGDGWKNELIVCKFLFSKVCSKPSCAFQHLE